MEVTLRTIATATSYMPYFCVKSTRVTGHEMGSVKSHVIVARLDGESPHIKVKKLSFNFGHLHCLETLHRLVTLTKNEPI